MRNDDIARKELLALLDSKLAHMDTGEALSDFPLEHINAKPPNSPYSCWHILEHMRIAMWDIVEFIRDPDHVSPDYPDGYRPESDTATDVSGWRKSVEGLQDGIEDLKEMIRDPKVDIFAPLDHAPEYTIFREVLTAADHLSYHTGELAMMRQVMDLWPDGEPYLTG